MVNPEVVLEKLRHIRGALQRMADKNPQSQLELFGNPDTQDVVLRNMQNALQACLDLASHFVADEGWGSPARAAEFFSLLGEHKVIPKDLAESMVKWVKFRNILVHEYTRLDGEKTWLAISKGRVDVEKYCSAIASWMTLPGSSKD